MGKRDLVVSGSTFKILEFAFFMGSVTIKQATLLTAKGKNNAATVKGMRLLYEREYLEQILEFGKTDQRNITWGSKKKEEKKYFRITQDGIRQLCKNSPAHRQIQNLAAEKTPLSKARENDTKNTLAALSHAAGLYTYTATKPSFENLAWLMNENLEELDSYPPEYPITGTDELDALLRKGIFYTSDEVRKGLLHMDFMPDAYQTTRFQALIVTGTKLYLCYEFDSDKGYLLLFKETEEALISVLKNLLPRYESAPAALVTGKTSKGAAVIATGHAHARDKQEEKRITSFEERTKDMDYFALEEAMEKEMQRRKNSKGNKINRNQISKILTGDSQIFPEIYFAPVTIQEKQLFANTLKYTRSKMLEEGAAWFEAHKLQGFSAGIRKDHPVNGTYTKDGQYMEAAYFPVFDCKLLAQIRNHQKEEIALVTNKSMADTLSQILGTRVKLFFDLDGQEIEGVKRYKDTGYPQGEDHFARLAQMTKERAVKRREEGFLPNHHLTIYATPETRKEGTRAVKRSGVSMYTLASKALEFALFEKQSEFMEYIKNKDSEANKDPPL